jgi:hypothetical protein
MQYMGTLDTPFSILFHSNPIQFKDFLPPNAQITKWQRKKQRNKRPEEIELHFHSETPGSLAIHKTKKS